MDIVVPTWALWTLAGLLYFAIGILFARWLYRANKNKPEIEMDSILSIFTWPIYLACLTVVGLFGLLFKIITIGNK